MATSTDLDNEKRRKMQNMLLSKAKKRRMVNEIETNQQSSSTSSKDDEICVVYHTKKEIKKKEEEEVVFIGENKTIEKVKGKEEVLLRGMATQALIREANRSALRAKEYGPQGWLKPRALTTNKRFLARTLQSVELDRKEFEQKRKMLAEKRRAAER
uniref:RRP15-like protein n=1 Tax=Meloidogyne javanica TaxID=6303 RepID=A0A915LBV5_MELJA